MYPVFVLLTELVGFWESMYIHPTETEPQRIVAEQHGAGGLAFLKSLLTDAAAALRRKEPTNRIAFRVMRREELRLDRSSQRKSIFYFDDGGDVWDDDDVADMRDFDGIDASMSSAPASPRPHDDGV